MFQRIVILLIKWSFEFFPETVYSKLVRFQTTRSGESALPVAASKGLERLTKKLIEKGANPNLQTTSGKIFGVVEVSSAEKLSMSDNNP